MKTLEDTIAETIAAKAWEKLGPKLEQLLAQVGGDELVTIRGAAALAKVRPATIRRWIREGHLVARGKARGLRVSRKELLSLRREAPAAAKTTETAEAAAERMMRRTRGTA